MWLYHCSWVFPKWLSINSVNHDEAILQHKFEELCSFFAFQRENVTCISKFQIEIHYKFTQINLTQNETNQIVFQKTWMHFKITHKALFEKRAYFQPPLVDCRGLQTSFTTNINFLVNSGDVELLLGLDHYHVSGICSQETTVLILHKNHFERLFR